MGNIFFERFAELCKEIGETPNSIAREIGASSGSVTAWKNGAEPRYSTVSKIADHLNTSVDYLLGRTSDPINYDDGDLIATIPLSYMEACDGDVRRAYAMMIAVDNDAKNERASTGFGERDILDEVDIAFYGEYRELTEDDKETVRDMVRVMRERRAKKQEQ